MDQNLTHKHRNFKGQLEDEAIVCFTRKHWVQVFPSLFAALIVGLSTFALPFIFEKKTMSGAIGEGGFFVLASAVIIFFTYTLHFLFTKIFNYYLRIMLVTNQRIVDLNKTLFITDHRLTMMLSEIQDVSMDKVGIMQTLFNYGTINIVVSGTAQVKSIHRVPNPDYHFRKIVQARQEYMNRMAAMQNTQVSQPAPLPPTPTHPLEQTENAMRTLFRPLPVESPASDAVLPLQ